MYFLFIALYVYLILHGTLNLWEEPDSYWAYTHILYIRYTHTVHPVHNRAVDSNLPEIRLDRTWLCLWQFWFVTSTPQRLNAFPKPKISYSSSKFSLKCKSILKKIKVVFQSFLLLNIHKNNRCRQKAEPPWWREWISFVLANIWVINILFNHLYFMVSVCWTIWVT